MNHPLLTQLQKDLCLKAAEIAPLLSAGWTSFYNAKDRRTEIFVEGDTGAEAAPILLATEELTHADREFAVRGVQMLHAVMALAQRRGWVIETLRQELRKARGEPDPADQHSKARWCAMVCQSREFKDWLFSQGVDVSDQHRVDNHVRQRLRIETRADLDTNPAALRAWENMWRDFKSTDHGRAYRDRQDKRRQGR